MSSADPLANVVWSALTTNHASFAEGDGRARRYQPGVSVFTGMVDDDPASWADLAAVAGPGRGVVLFRELDVVAPEGWTLLGGGRGHQMVLTGALPAVAPGIELVELGAADAAEMAALVELAKPGPWGPRTHELGGYLGIRDPGTGMLLAMAGRRISIPGLTEVSAVSTHPDARRRGYGEAVTVAVAQRLLDEGITPFLHVAESNDGARRVYERIGFSTRRMTQFAALRTPDVA